LSDYTSYYTNTLETLGVTYDYWNVFMQLSPPRAVLDQYDKVLIYTGDYGGIVDIGGGLWLFDALNHNDLRNYLAAGGKALVFGQDAIGDYLMQLWGLGNVDGLGFMRGASDNPLSDSVFGYAEPSQPSIVGSAEYSPFLKDMVLDISFAGDGAGNQYQVDEVDWLNFIDNDNEPLFQVPNTVTGTVESGYVATRSSYEPTLERVDDPNIAWPVSWRIAYLAFGLEGVNNDTGYATREDLVDALFSWLDDEISVTFDQTSYFSQKPFAFVTLDATMLSTEGADAVYYRWDFGDGSDIEWTTDPTVDHQYQEMGFYNARVEVMDEYGHKIVSEPVQVQVGSYLYLPLVNK
jgi:hypothetical protein